MPFLTKIGAALKAGAANFAKNKAKEKAIETALDEEKRGDAIAVIGCGSIGCIAFPFIVIIAALSYLFGTIQIADGAEITGSGSSATVTLGEAAKYTTEAEKIAWLYDGNGVPKTSTENEKYLETFEVEYLDASGQEKTMNLTMHKKLKTEIQAIFREMKSVNFKLEWESGGGSIRGWGTDGGYTGNFSESAHCYGHAVDINVNANPCIGTCGHVGGTYAPGVDPFSVTEEIVNIWKKHGFYWGGDWTSLKDYMHFSYFNH